MKNLFKVINEKIEKATQGYNRRSLTASYLAKTGEEEQKKAVDEMIEDIERKIVQSSKENQTCIISLVGENSSESYKKTLRLSLAHFEAQGFKLAKRDLEELGDSDTSYYILSWKKEVVE